MFEKLKNTIKSIDNLEDMFTAEGQDVEVIFGLEEIKKQINEIIKEEK